jgi:hypothetical protein
MTVDAHTSTLAKTNNDDHYIRSTPLFRNAALSGTHLFNGRKQSFCDVDEVLLSNKISWR